MKSVTHTILSIKLQLSASDAHCMVVTAFDDDTPAVTVHTGAMYKLHQDTTSTTVTTFSVRLSGLLFWNYSGFGPVRTIGNNWSSLVQGGRLDVRKGTLHC